MRVVFAVSVIVTAATVGGALASEQSGERFTELYLLTVGENGELTADDYPTNLTRGESVPLVVGVTNKERRVQSYTVVVVLQRIDERSGSTRILDEAVLHRFQMRLAHNETWEHRHRVTPQFVGERNRLVYLLYRGTPPDEPSTENAYREVHLWVTIRS